MADPINQILGALLRRVIIVSAVLVVMKLVADGVYVPALALALALAAFAVLRFWDPRLLR